MAGRLAWFAPHGAIRVSTHRCLRQKRTLRFLSLGIKPGSSLQLSAFSLRMTSATETLSGANSSARSMMPFIAHPMMRPGPLGRPEPHASMLGLEPVALCSRTPAGVMHRSNGYGSYQRLGKRKGQMS